MVKPLPPVVHGPITPASPQVLVTAVARNAAIELLVNGSYIGSAFSLDGGSVWVTISSSIGVGDLITAKQSSPDGTSDESAQPVVVVEVPSSLPAPVFVTPLSTCMSSFRLDGLIPGATVSVQQGGSLVAQRTASQTCDWFSVSPSTSLSAGWRLTAEQEVVVSGWTYSSPTTSSLPLVETNSKEPLPAPGIGQPLIACRTSLDFFAMVPSADVLIENEGNTGSILNVASAYHGWGLSPLKQGKLVAKQSFPRCGIESSESVVSVGPPQPPGKPVIQATPCPKLRKVHLSGLEANAVVVISTVTPDPNLAGAVVITPIGEAVASYSSETFDLPLGVEPVTAFGDAVLLTAHQTLCEQQSHDALRVGFAMPGGPYAPPKITTPLFECARRVQFTGAHPSSLLQPFYADSGDPIGNAVIATSADGTLGLWFPLAPSRKVLVRQTGCDADGDSPVVPITNLPDPLPTPTINEPVRPLAAGVRVANCLPGARVHLLVNEVVRKSMETFADDMTIPTADLALAEYDELWAMQTICAKESDVEGHRTVVQKGEMVIGVQPATVERGTTVNMTVNAKDKDTGAHIVGAQVLLNGVAKGQTGAPFSFSAAAGQSDPAGDVKGGQTHYDATFMIHLKDPPTQPQGKLFLNVSSAVLIPNVLRMVSAKWTVTSLWTPTVTLSATGQSVGLSLPTPPPHPADQRVSVVLETVWEVAGVINGITFGYQQFPGHMYPHPTLLAWTGSDLSVSWLVQWGIEYDNAGVPWIIVVTNYIPPP